MRQCSGITKCGKRCKKKGIEFCGIHKNQNIECSICLGSAKNKIQLDCEHKFCKNCILKWMCSSLNCPLCRQKITDKKIIDKFHVYGCRRKLLIIVQECNINLSILSHADQELFERIDITPFQFMCQEEWEEKSKSIPEELLDRLETTYTYGFMKINSPTEWDYYNKYNRIYLFD